MAPGLSAILWSLAQRGNEPVKASPGFISKSNIPIPPQKAFIPKIRINGGSDLAFSDYAETKRGRGDAWTRFNVDKRRMLHCDTCLCSGGKI